MANNSEQARSSHSSCCICWPIVRFSPREFPNDEIMANLKCAKYYPLVICYVAIENGPVEIVDFPIDSMVIFHSYVNVYQRVSGL